ncbi:MAG: lathosterol oxidase [Cyclobacteriaceae bacterium]|jgi:sterol desaturase/sphingolipid hydroxylase (fatty acid hydroxylase superfamily)
MENLQTAIEKIPFTYMHVGLRYLLCASLFFVIFYVIFKNSPFLSKIQSKFPRSNDYYRDFGYSAITIFIFSVIAVLTFTVLAPYSLLIADINANSIGYHVGTFVLMFFLHDLYFYGIHRFMHLPKYYKRFHRVHHQSTNPSPWTAYAFHPLESILEGLILTIIAFTIPSHRLVVIIFFLFQIVYNVYGHLGYELYPKGFHKTMIGKWVNTSVAHNLHHHKFSGNYGLYTLIWDRIFGTLREEYDEAFEKAKEPIQKKSLA